MSRARRGGFMHAISRIEYTVAGQLAQFFAVYFVSRGRERFFLNATSPLTSLFYRSPSIDNQRVPGKKLCVHEVGNSVSDVGWLARAVKRSEFDEVRLPIGRIARHRDRAWGDGVHPNFRRQRLRQY